MRIVYVTHNGIGTALVRSQVLPYLRILAAAGHEIDLVTFERGDQYPEGEFPRDRWHAAYPRAGRSLLAKIADILVGARLVAQIARRRRAQVLHARSYLPAAICWFVGLLLRLPYVFDMRGFLGEEYVDAEVWAPNDMRYRALRFAERHLLRDAAAVVVLTHAAARRLHSEPRYVRDVRSKNITVVPCAVDLDRFRSRTSPSSVPTLVYSGSLGMWYLLDEMVSVYAKAREAEPKLRFLFLNRNEHGLIRRAWERAGLPAESVEIRAASFGEVPSQLQRAHVGISLLRQVPSKVGSSPIKIAEYLACGLPVVVNEGLGDSDEQIRAADAGHVMRSYDPPALATAGSAIVSLIRDAAASGRARSLAEDVFDVRAGASAYDGVYRGIARARPSTS